MSNRSGYISLDGASKLMKAAACGKWSPAECDDCIGILIDMQNERLAKFFEEGGAKATYAAQMGHMLPWGLEDGAIAAIDTRRRGGRRKQGQ